MASKMMFTKATKEKAKLRLALSGPAGSGKTWSALSIARALVGDKGRIALVDTEHESASKYAADFDFDRITITHDYHPRQVGEAIKAAAEAGYDVIIIDSMSFFWNGVGGFLSLVDEEVKRQKAKGLKADSFAAWKDVDPVYKHMVQAILGAPIHVIVTLRAKTEYDRTQETEGGKTRIKKVGTAPEMRDHFQYEMDVEGMLDMDHNLIIGKTRCSTIDGRVFAKPGEDFARMLRAWLDAGVEAITDAQKAEGNALLAELGVTDGKKAYVASLNAGDAPRDATEMESVLAQLRARVIAKKAAPVPSTPAPSTPPVATAEREPGGPVPASAEERAEMRALARAFNPGLPDAEVDEWIALTARQLGMSGGLVITHAQACVMIGALRRRAAEQQGGSHAASQ